MFLLIKGNLLVLNIDAITNTPERKKIRKKGTQFFRIRQDRLAVFNGKMIRFRINVNLASCCLDLKDEAVYISHVKLREIFLLSFFLLFFLWRLITFTPFCNNIKGSAYLSILGREVLYSIEQFQEEWNTSAAEEYNNMSLISAELYTYTHMYVQAPYSQLLLLGRCVCCLTPPFNSSRRSIELLRRCYPPPPRKS